MNNNVKKNLFSGFGLNKKLLVNVFLFVFFVFIGVISVAQTASASFIDIGTVLSDDTAGNTSNYTISFETDLVMSSGQDVVIGFPSGFDISNITYADVDLYFGSDHPIVDGSPGLFDIGFSKSGQIITFTIGAGMSFGFGSGDWEIEIGTNATYEASGSNQITNHSSAGSYDIGVSVPLNGSDNASFTLVSGDTTAPTVSTLSPLDNATDVDIDSNLVITFDEAVDVESGNITIKKTSDNSTIEAIDVTSGLVIGTGTDTITINPTADLTNGTGYYVQIDATAFDDTAGNSYAGISSTTSWSFMTVAAASTGGGFAKTTKQPGNLSLSLYLDKDENKLQVSGRYSDNNAVVKEVGFEYWTDDEDNKETIVIKGTPTNYKYYLTGLLCGEYTFRSYVKNSKYTSNSDEETIKINSNCDEFSSDVIIEGEDEEEVSEEDKKDEEASNVVFSSLRHGDNSPEVKQLQKLLNKIGFTLALDGPGSPENETMFYGQRTYDAVKRFQSVIGVSQTGFVDGITLDFLNLIALFVEV